MSDDWGDLPEPSEEELAEAAALQVALDRGHDEGGVAEDAMEAAHLLSFSAGGELSKERADAVLDDVLKHARRPEPEPKKSWWRVLVPVSLLGAATAAFLLTMQSPVVIPTPSLGILQAQAAAAAGSDPEGLDQAMGDYRQNLYAALEGNPR